MRSTKHLDGMRLGPIPAHRCNGPNSVLAGGFYNDLEPKRLKGKETPQDRAVLELAKSGMRTVQIARALELSPATVSNTLRQPFARKYLTESMKELGDASFQELLDIESRHALKVVGQIMREGEKEDNRLKAAQDIINRRYGTPAQSVKVTTEGPVTDYTDDQLKEVLNS